MANWPFTPQGVVVETLTDAIHLVRTGAQTTIVGRSVTDVVRALRLTYLVVTSEEVRSMAAFFAARRGAFEAFTITNPVDGQSYQVRFDSDLHLENFTPAFFRSNALSFTVVDS
jgi:hypothetical protein